MPEVAIRRTVLLATLGVWLAASTAYAQVVRPLLRFPREFTGNVAIDDAGTVIYAVTSTNQFGTNPGYLKQIVRWDPVTGAGTPITDFEEGVESVSVSNDDTWLAFVSCADPLGTNHDESAELFVMHPDGTGLAQLTSENLLPLGRRGIRAAVISGSGNRIAFVGRVNPLGTNSEYATALFVIDRDGTNLRQLATNVLLAQEIFFTGWPGLGFDISDDGVRVVYITAGREIAGIDDDGTGNHTFSSTTNAADVVISGNGAKIVYTTGFSVKPVRARTFDGDSGTIVTLSNGDNPSITDDATTVYFTGNPAGIYRIPSTGGTATLVRAELKLVRAAGSGSRLVARERELLALDNTGASQQQLTTTTVPGQSVDDLAFATNGVALRFSSTFDPLGTNPGRAYEQFSFDVDTGQFTQLTDASLPAIDKPGFSDPGDIYFTSAENLTGQNTCFVPQMFRRAPNGWLTQVTSCVHGAVFTEYPRPRPDGVVIAFRADGTSDREVAVINFDGAGRLQLRNGLTGTFTQDALGASGTGDSTWVAYARGGQVFRVKGDGTNFLQVSNSQAQFSQIRVPSISDDGNRVAWYAWADETGQIPDSYEAFFFDAATGLHQLTQTVGDPVGFQARVTRNGNWVFAGEGRYDANTLALEPAAGFPRFPGRNFDLQPDATGNRWLVAIYDRLDNNPPSQEFYLADMNAPPSFMIGKASPTVLSWDPAPTSLRYDVIRGSISNLSGAGSTVNLGPVNCIEDDSPDAHTKGHGDPADPAPGQVFFYLYRGSVGFNASTGSYGQGSGGKERVAGAGDCNP